MVITQSDLRATRCFNRDPIPDEETLSAWDVEGIAEATDGCTVEPDGVCEHGCQSWLLALSLI